MYISILKSKIHRAKVTQSDLNYEGSILIDEEMMVATDLIEGEKVDVLNINNGERFTTYVIKGKKKSLDIQVNGAAARKVQKGDLLIIISYMMINKKEANQYKPKILLLDN